MKTPWEAVQQNLQAVIEDIKTDLASLGLEAGRVVSERTDAEECREVISSTFDQILSSLRTEIKNRRSSISA